MADFDLTRYAWTIRVARLRVLIGFAVAAMTMWLARPTWTSLAGGGMIAAVGCAIRIWAAGHLDKAREVTTTGPYRYTRHPLYVGSSIMAIGVVTAAADARVAAVVLGYVAVTFTAAVRLEEAWLRARFGTRYDDYASGRLRRVSGRFSLARARANGEHLAVLGLAGGMAVFAVKAWLAGR